MVFSFNI